MRLIRAWGDVTPEEGYQGLKRITVNQESQESLAALIEARLGRMVRGEPEVAGMVLERLVEDSPGRHLTDDDIWQRLARHGISQKDPGRRRATRGQVRRAVAGVRSDSPSTEDLLGVHGDVRTLAELIAATETQPPLAIALIGDWGAGKSSLMLQVEREIEALAVRSRSYPGKSAFAGSIRQVRFNAWHYSDDQLWAGLISHLFQVLAASAPDADAPVPDTAQVQRDREQLCAKVKDKEKECERLDAELSAAARRARPQGSLARLGSPGAIVRNLLTIARLSFRDVRTSLLTLTIWVIAFSAAWAAWHFLAAWVAVALATGGMLAAPLISPLATIRSWHQKMTLFAARKHDQLIARQHDIQEELCSLREDLERISAVARLSSFLDERGAPAAYGGYQGLPGRVCADLQHLSETLAQAREEWTASGSLGSAPLERIVLYIDDLDRCPPVRVVEVLEAVHLMLALDLFVVVVAVDARWLIRSLEYHHRDLFSAESPAAVRDDEKRVATPVDYLDKIFQIPYVVLPPAPEVVGRYLQALLPTADFSGNTQTAPPDTSTPPGGGNAAPPESGSRDEPQEGTRDPVGGTAGSPSPPVEGESADRAGEDTVPADLRPPGLKLSRAEVEFMARLGGLISTPRAAKRMVNIYRLVRIGIPDEDLPEFTGDEKGGPYQKAQILLAILAGSPAVAEDVFRALLDAPPADSMVSVLQEMRQEARFSGNLLASIENEIFALGAETGLSLTAADCQRWCPLLARFSFHTRDLAKFSGKSALGAPLPDCPASSGRS